MTSPNTPAPTTSPSSIPTPSSTTFANAPIHALLQTPTADLDESGLREFTKTLRTLRANHQAFQKQLRIDGEAKGRKTKAKEPSESAKKKLTDEYLNL